ncbi:MAG: SLAC1 anion channel family protein [Bacteroidetes bacterium]|nr:SLAC1 anion channel family protein [Bacteroidota bacterium]
MTATKAQPSLLEFLPASIFGSVMGLTGLSFCWGWATTKWGVSGLIKDLLGGVAILLFLLLTIAYLLKWKKHPELVRIEFNHPVSVSFFGTFIVSLLLLPGVLFAYSKPLATGIWATGAVLMAAFSWFVFRRWLGRQQDPANALPAWLLPIVGTLDIPVVGARLAFPGVHEINLLFFAIGIAFATILMTIIVYRLLFFPPLPQAIQPSLMILVGPFALATSTYDSFTGAHDIVLSVFFYFDLALLVLFGSKLALLPVCCPFRVGWWAVSFPLVAFTIAAFRYSAQVPSKLFQLIPGILLALSTLVILYLLVQSLYKIFTHQLFLPDPAAENATRMLEPATKPQP